MRRLVLVLVAVAAAAVVGAASPAGACAPPFRGSVAGLSAAVRQTMTGVSWRRGLPRRRSTISVSCEPATGASTAGSTRGGSSCTATSPATSSPCSAGSTPRGSRSGGWSPVDAYGGSDFRSIEADNTSAFNCRPVDGHDPLVGARVRPRDRPQPDREPVRLRGRHDVAPGEPAVPRPVAVPRRAWRSRAARSCARSTRSAGAGAAAGRATGTTSTSRRAADDRRARARRRGGAPGGRLAAPLRADGASVDGLVPARCVRHRLGAARRRALGAVALRLGHALGAPRGARPRVRRDPDRPARVERRRGAAPRGCVCAPSRARGPALRRARRRGRRSRSATRSSSVCGRRRTTSTRSSTTCGAPRSGARTRRWDIRDATAPRTSTRIRRTARWASWRRRCSAERPDTWRSSRASAFVALAWGSIGVARGLGLARARRSSGRCSSRRFPLIALQASTAQNDLVVAVVPGRRRRAPPRHGPRRALARRRRDGARRGDEGHGGLRHPDPPRRRVPAASTGRAAAARLPCSSARPRAPTGTSSTGARPEAGTPGSRTSASSRGSPRPSPAGSARRSSSSSCRAPRSGPMALLVAAAVLLVGLAFAYRRRSATAALGRGGVTARSSRRSPC